MTDDKINTGGPAFPVTFEGGENNGDSPFFDKGMTLRDHFAAKALNGLLSNGNECPPFGTIDEVCDHFAKIAYSYADAMIAAREAKP